MRIVEREVGERSLKIGIHQQKRSEGDFVKSLGGRRRSLEPLQSQDIGEEELLVKQAV